MKMSTLAMFSTVFSLLLLSGANAQQLRQPLSVRPTGFNYNNFQDAEAASPSDAIPDAPAADAEPVGSSAIASTTMAPSCGCPDAACDSGCDSASCCSSGCGLGCLGGLCDCSLGDAWTLSGFIHGDCEPCVTVGGWFQFGYHTKGNDLFNSRPNEVALQQGWLYAEKVAEACKSPLGFRIDMMYGLDADDTQAFGNNPGRWDFQNGYDYGSYGWAIPQFYGELAIGEWSIKAGHFYTLVGYEVVTAPDNFFYSHAMTMYNSEPFTHTGIIGSRSVTDKLEIHAGWTLGWDTGFDQFGNGNSWLGGFSYAMSDDATLTYISTAGDFGWRGDNAYGHSVVLDMNMTDNLNWVVQSDLLQVDSTGENTIGLNQYFLYTVSDCLGLGARVEWYKADTLTGYAPHGGVLPADGNLSYYAATFGANIRRHANLLLRPEVRVDWSPAANYDQTYFGMDAIFTF